MIEGRRWIPHEVTGIESEPDLDPEIIGCLRLWGYVLIRMTHDVTKKNVAERNRDAALFWFQTESWTEDDVGSFRWVCDLFDTDPDWARRSVASGRLAKVVRELGL